MVQIFTCCLIFHHFHNLCNNRNIQEYSTQFTNWKYCTTPSISTQHNPLRKKKYENLRISININCYNISSHSATSSSFIVFSLKINLKRDYKHFLLSVLFSSYTQKAITLLCIHTRVKVKLHSKMKTTLW